MSATVHTRVLAVHRETIVAVIGYGRTVARGWPDTTVADAGLVRRPLAAALEAGGLDRRLVAMLPTAADALETSIQGAPVPAPPYLAVTSRGPVVRGTLDDGRRLVLTLRVFAVDREAGRYRFRDPRPEDALAVDLR